MSDVVLIHSPMILYTDLKDKEKFKEHGGDEKSYYPLGDSLYYGYVRKIRPFGEDY